MRLIKYLFIFGLVCGVLAAIGVAGVVWHFSQDLPSTEGLRDVRLQVPLRIYSADNQLIGEYGAERREPLAYQEIPDPLIKAFLAAEDDRFFKHPGVDYQGLLRAAWVLALTGEKAQGGSTITMQLARNFFLSSEKSYVRKVREILLALQMERQLSKQEILTFYLNKIFLGHRAYGIGAAAKVYYGKELPDLSLAQMAMIAGLPKAPSRYNPISGPQRALLRRNYVLRRMRELEYIDDAAYQTALDEPISAELRRATIDLEAHYVAEYARGRIINQFGLDAYTSGIEVVTTIHAKPQRAAVAALRKNLIDYDLRHGYRGPEAQLGDLGQELDGLDGAELEAVLGPMLEEFSSVGGLEPALVLAVDESKIRVWSSDSGVLTLDANEQPYEKLDQVLTHGDLVRLKAADADDGKTSWSLAQVPEVQGALVSIDPQNGAVLAMAGGFDYFASKFNRAMQAQRQPGSSFKPFVYSAALENGFTPATVINDAPVVFHDAALGGAWRPQNYSGRFYGPTPLRTGLYNSRNLVAIRVLEGAGLDTVRNYVTRFGFERDRIPRDLSMALGTGVFSPLEMAGGFAVFANGGYRVEPYLIEQVRTAEGEVLHQALPPSVCEAACQRERDAELKAQAEMTEVREALRTSALQGEVQEMVFPPAAERVISEANAYVMTDMLRDVVQRGTARRARQLGRNDLAGKTGTTNDQIDAWFCGFNARHVAVSWVGFDDIKPLGSRETGSRAALPMWIDYMGVALDGVPSQVRPQPAGVVSARIDPDTGMLASYGSANAQFEIFIEGKLPEAADYGYAAQDGVTVEGAPPSREDELLEDIF
ncbi:MAG: penicillin-binding protein 1A [Oceanococcus sp.]|nr:MAG: penicillin-binding protein 1A [Oceanococcus sp.]